MHLIRQKRKGKGLTIEDLAAETGIHQAEIQRIEAGTADNPRVKHLIAISRALRVSLDRIIKEYK